MARKTPTTTSYLTRSEPKPHRPSSRIGQLILYVVISIQSQCNLGILNLKIRSHPSVNLTVSSSPHSNAMGCTTSDSIHSGTSNASQRMTCNLKAFSTKSDTSMECSGPKATDSSQQRSLLELNMVSLAINDIISMLSQYNLNAQRNPTKTQKMSSECSTSSTCISGTFTRMPQLHI